jgi:hypothetical protein
MNETLGSQLSAWESFYVIVGSSGGALTGLQFVVIALIAETRQRATFREIDAFGTPTVVHFCTVLLMSAILSAPWPVLTGASFLLAVTGATGIGYVIIVTRRAQRQTRYKPVLEDWIWHVAIPFVCYTVLVLAAIALVRYTTTALFIIAAVALILLFAGIHNSWDTVTYVVVQRDEERENTAAEP